MEFLRIRYDINDALFFRKEGFFDINNTDQVFDNIYESIKE